MTCSYPPASGLDFRFRPQAEVNEELARGWQARALIVEAKNEKLSKALKPFAMIGDQLAIAGPLAIPDGASAKYLKLGSLTAAEFRNATTALVPLTLEDKP